MKYKLLPLVLFGLFSVKLLVLGGGYESCIMLAILAAASHLYLKNDKDEEIIELRTHVAKLENKMDQKQKEFDEIKSYVGSQKINGSFKAVR